MHFLTFHRVIALFSIPLMLSPTDMLLNCLTGNSLAFIGDILVSLSMQVNERVCKLTDELANEVEQPVGS